MNQRRGRVAAAIGVAVVGLPLLGAALAGDELGTFFQFPPRLEILTGYVRFSWLAAAAVAALLAAIAVSWIGAAGDERQEEAFAAAAARASFPAWGWLAAAWTLGWWVMAWTRFERFEPWQRFTFFPLWLGFIVTVNALTQRRAGTCLLRRAPGRWLALFGASAIFWWAFEWLNRFVRNWHYLGVEDFGALGYAVHATVCFSTVLPAVAAVAEWLGSHAGWRRRIRFGPRWPWMGRRGTAWVFLVGGATALLFTGARPVWFYPALWVAPLALALGAQIFGGRRGIAGELAAGDWSNAATWMVAAVVCGFFWELWNWHSAAKWIYTVPGVERWHLFEMPLLGYVGYLPFGLECLLAANWLGVASSTHVTRLARREAPVNVSD